MTTRALRIFMDEAVDEMTEHLIVAGMCCLALAVIVWEHLMRFIFGEEQ